MSRLHWEMKVTPARTLQIEVWDDREGWLDQSWIELVINRTYTIRHREILPGNRYTAWTVRSVRLDMQP